MRRADRARVTEPGRPLGHSNGIWKPITSALLLVLCIRSSDSSPINRQVGISENVFITVQNDTYGNEQRVCSIDSVTYEDGDSIPTSSPCEHCICRPPGFACTIISCEYRPGCKALKRSNQCCPEYQCECEKDGKIYQNGEKILDNNNPCEVCYCQGGDVICAVIDCYWRSDCQPRYIENRCCPLYDHCPPPRHPGPIRPIQEITSTTASSTAGWFNWSSTAVPSTAIPVFVESTTEKLTTTLATTESTSSTTKSAEIIQIIPDQPSTSSPPAQVSEHQSTESVIATHDLPSSSPATIIPSPSAEIDTQQGQSQAEAADRVVVKPVAEIPVPVITSEAPVPSSESPVVSSESPASNLIPDSQPEEIQVSQSTTVLPELTSSVESVTQASDSQSDVEPSQAVEGTVTSSVIASLDSDVNASPVQKLPPVEETQTSDLSEASGQLPASTQSSLLESSLSPNDLEGEKNDQPTEILESAAISTTTVTPTAVAIEASTTESINSTPTLSTSPESIAVPVSDSEAPSHVQQEITSQSDIAADQAPTEPTVEVATSVHDEVAKDQPEIGSSTTTEHPILPVSVQESTSKLDSLNQDSPNIPVPSQELQPPYNPEVESQNEITVNDGLPVEVAPKPSLELQPPHMFNNEIIVPDLNANNALPTILSQTKPLHEVSPALETQPSGPSDQNNAISATESQPQVVVSNDNKPTDSPVINIILQDIVQDSVSGSESSTSGVTEISSDDVSSQVLDQSTETPVVQVVQDIAQDVAATVQPSPQYDSVVPTEHSPSNEDAPASGAVTVSELVLDDEVSGLSPTLLPVSDDVQEVETATTIPENDEISPVLNDQIAQGTSNPLGSVQDAPSEVATTQNVLGANDQAQSEPLDDDVAEVGTESPIVNDAGSESHSGIAVTEGAILNDEVQTPTTESALLSDDVDELNEQALPTTIPFADQAATTTVDGIDERIVSNAGAVNDDATATQSTVPENEDTKLLKEVSADQKVESVEEPVKQSVSINNEEQVATTVAPALNDDILQEDEQTTSNYAIAHDAVATEGIIQNDDKEVTTTQPLQNIAADDQASATERLADSISSEDTKFRLDASVFKDISKESHDESEQLPVVSVTELGLAQSDEVALTTTPATLSPQSAFNDEVASDNEVVFDNVPNHTTEQAEVKPELIVKSKESIVSNDAEQRETTEINRKANEELQDGLSIELTTASSSTLGEGRKDLDSLELTEEPPSGPQHDTGSDGGSNSESVSDLAKPTEVTLLADEKVAEDEVPATTEAILLLRHHQPNHEGFGLEEETTRLPQHHQIHNDDKSENIAVHSFSLDVTTVVNDDTQDEEATTIRQQADFRSGLEITSAEDAAAPIGGIDSSTSPSIIEESPNGSVSSDDVPQENSANLDNLTPTNSPTEAPVFDDPAVTTLLPDSFDDTGSTPLNLFAKNDEITSENISDTTSAPLSDNTSQPESLHDSTGSSSETEVSDNSSQPPEVNDNSSQSEIFNDNTSKPDPLNDNTPQPETLNDNTSQPDILADDIPATTNSPLGDDTVVDSTTLQSKVNETESTNEVKTVVLPDILKKLDPISDDIAQFRHDLPMQNQFKTEDQSWYWRTVNRVRRLPQFLKTLTRQPRATPTEETKPTKTKKAYPTVKHKKRFQRPFLFW